MNETEAGQLSELCTALGITFRRIKKWPKKETVKYVNRMRLEGSDDLFPDDYLAPLYNVEIEFNEFEGQPIPGKFFMHYHSAITYLEIKFGKYGDIKCAY